MNSMNYPVLWVSIAEIIPIGEAILMDFSQFDYKK